MKQIADIFEITPSYNVIALSGTDLIMKSGYQVDKFILVNEARPDQKTSVSDAGTLYNFEIALAIDKLSQDYIEKYNNNRPVILVLYRENTSDRLIIGTIDNPARVTIEHSVDYDILIIKFSSKTTVL